MRATGSCEPRLQHVVGVRPHPDAECLPQVPCVSKLTTCSFSPAETRGRRLPLCGGVLPAQVQGPDPPEERGKGARLGPGAEDSEPWTPLAHSEALGLQITVETLPLPLRVAGLRSDQRPQCQCRTSVGKN